MSPTKRSERVRGCCDLFFCDSQKLFCALVSNHDVAQRLFLAVKVMQRQGETNWTRETHAQTEREWHTRGQTERQRQGVCLNKTNENNRITDNSRCSLVVCCIFSLCVFVLCLLPFLGEIKFLYNRKSYTGRQCPYFIAWMICIKSLHFYLATHLITQLNKSGKLLFLL